MNTFLEILITVGRFLVGLWPIMFLSVFVGVVKRRKGFGAVLRTSVNALMVTWGFFALLNLVFYFLKMDTFHLLPQEVNMKYFLCVGLVLLPFEFAILLEQRHKKIDADTIEEMKALTPAQFERLVAETYRAQGHKVDIVGATGDHGVDVVVHTRKGETWLVQCKKYKGKVGEPVIRDFYGTLRAAEADAGAVITTGSITAQARLWAEGKPIFLYDGYEFLKVIQTAKLRKSFHVTSKKGTADTSDAPVEEAQPVAEPALVKEPVLQPLPEEPVVTTGYTPSTTYANAYADEGDLDVSPIPDKRPFMNMHDVPDCPACGVPMILHTERRPLMKPKQEYICQNAPSCDETVAA